VWAALDLMTKPAQRRDEGIAIGRELVATMMRRMVFSDNQDGCRIASSRNAPERGRALPHQNAPGASSACQSITRAPAPFAA
jgi:hypothetical protein